MLALISALVAPYFLPWDNYRGWFEAQASRIAGAEVSVLGSIDARLLPEPQVRFSDVRVGDASAPYLTAAGFHMRVALTPLMRGEIEVVDMSLDRPDVSLEIDENGAFEWLPALSLGSEERETGVLEADPNDDRQSEVILSDVEITNGALTVRYGPDAQPVRFDDLNLALTAQSLDGPFKVNGSGTVDGSRVDMDIATGARYPDGSIRVVIELAAAEASSALNVDGRLSFPDGRPSYEGRFEIAPASATPVQMVDDVIPADPELAADLTAVENAATIETDPDGLAVEGSFALTPERLLLPQAAVKIGAADDALAIDLVGSLDFGDAPRFEALISADQLDIDRVLGSSQADPLSVSEAFYQVGERIKSLPATGIPGSLSIELPGFVAGGALVRDLRFDATTDGGTDGWTIQSAEAELPGNTRFFAGGQIGTTETGSFQFDGRVSLSSGRPSALFAWWQPDAMASGTVFPALDLSSDLYFEAGSLALSNARIETDGATLEGTLTWQDEAQNGQRMLFALFDADQVNIDTLLAMAQSVSPNLAPFMESDEAETQSGAADQGPVNFDIRLAFDEARYRGSIANGVDIQMSFLNDILKVSNFEIKDWAGVEVAASGRIENVSTSADGGFRSTIKAETFEPFVAFLNEHVDNTPALRWLTEAAPSLADADLSATIRAARQGDGTRAELVLEGVAGGSNLDVQGGFEGQLVEWRNGQVVLRADLQSDDDLMLVSQLGFRPDVSTAIAAGLDLPTKRPGSLRGELRGTPEQSMNFDAEFELFNITAAIRGELDQLFGPSAPGIQADVTASSPDTSPAWHAFAQLAPLLGTDLPVEAAFTVDGSFEQMNVRSLQASISDVPLTGALQIDRRSQVTKISGQLEAATASSAALFALAAPPTALKAAEVNASDTEPQWPDVSLGEPALGPLTVEVEVQARAFDLGRGYEARNASFGLGYRDGDYRITDFSADFAGGQLSGEATVKRAQGGADLSVRGELSGALAEELGWKRRERPVVTGDLGLTFDINGVGQSVSGIVSALSGNGALTIEAGEVRSLDPDAFQSVVFAVDQGLPIEDGAVEATYVGYLEAGNLEFDRLEAAITFAAGTARMRNVPIDRESKARANAALDLTSLTLASDWTLTGEVEETTDVTPQAGLAFSGPIDRPSRTVDVGPLTAFLTLRNVQKQVDRIEELERLRAAEEAELDAMERRLLDQQPAPEADNGASLNAPDDEATSSDGATTDQAAASDGNTDLNGSDTAAETTPATTAETTPAATSPPPAQVEPAATTTVADETSGANDAVAQPATSNASALDLTLNDDEIGELLRSLPNTGAGPLDLGGAATGQ